MKIRTVRTFMMLVLASAPALAAGPRGELKVPRPLPDMADVKTPAPPAITGPSLCADPRAWTTSSAMPARITVPAAAGADVARRRTIDHVFASEGEDGVIWARGRTYKARFGTDGATYVPFLGSHAPASHPVRFATRSASVGGIPFECVPAAPVRAAETIAFARGGFVELWQLGHEGIEQQFVFDSLRASGDLVIRIDVSTDLAHSGEGGAIAFSNELGRVDYGAAVAIDAAGRRFAMTSALTDGTIELRLDAHDVARASLPLVVDPFVSTVPTILTGPDDYLPDVAHDAASGRYLIVYEETFSGTDHDIYSELHEASGAIVQGAYIDYTNEYWESPRVANNALAGTFLCVAAVGGPGSLRIIRGNTLTAHNGLIGTPFTIAAADSWDKLAPDVGGDPALVGPTYFLVTWERAFSASDHDVHARLVTGGGLLVGPGTILIDNSGATHDSHPAISKSNGHPPFSTQEWTIVWQRYSNLLQHHQVFGAQVHWDGTLTHGTYPIDATSDVVSRPRVSSLLDGDGVTRPYMVVCQFENLSGDTDVIGMVFEGTTFRTGTNIPNYVDLATLPRDQVLPCIDSDGSHFTVVYSQTDPAGTENWDVIAVDLVYAGDYPYVCESAFLATSLDQELDAAVTSTYSAGGMPRRFLAAWGQYSFALGVSDVAAAFYDGCEGGFTQAYCFGDGTTTGCPCGNVGAAGNGCASSVGPNGGHLGSSGNPRASSDTFVLQASGLPPGAASLYFQGLPSSASGGYFGAVFGDGIRCIAQQIRRIGTKFNPTGSSQYPEAGDPLVSVKGSIPANGAEVFYQVWYRNAGTFCTPSTFNLTNGLRAVWGP